MVDRGFGRPLYPLNPIVIRYARMKPFLKPSQTLLP
jgi:hypothetical protein